MSWESMKIGDFCEVTSSKRIFYDEYVPSGVPFWRSKEVILQEAGQTVDDPLFISEERYADLRHFGYPEEGDLLVTSVGTIGSIYRVKDGDRFYFKDGNLTWLRKIDAKRVNSCFLMYLLRSPIGQGLINSTLIGSSQKALTISALKGITVSLPEVEAQHRIASVLMAYDNLIENNRRQIVLLEEAAQRLYREWFVDLRFPGHEGIEIVDGIPSGWRIAPIRETCKKVQSGGTPSRKKAAYWNPGTVKWFKTGELQDCWLILPEEYISEDGLSGSAAKLFPPQTIVMAIYASPTLGRLGILNCEAAFNQAMLGFVIDENLVTRDWLYWKLHELRPEFNLIARGAGQQNISCEIVKNYEIVIPPRDLIERFTNAVASMTERRLKLQEQNMVVAEARDRLLPKLMSGEIEV